MLRDKINVEFDFVPYGREFEPQKNILVLDVGMKTVPGVIDHHHPQAEVECTASLIVKNPSLVLNHLSREKIIQNEKTLRVITHCLPDFDAVCSIFLSLMLLKKGDMDSSMMKIAQYTKMVDSARLPKNIDLASTPYSILRSLFRKIKKGKREASEQRVEEGIKFMEFLYSKSKEGYEIEQNRMLFSGIDRYEKAMLRAENDYFYYLKDLERAQKLELYLPLTGMKGKKNVDGLVVKNPHSFLLKEWARRDLKHSRLNEGFTFLMTNFGNKRYILGVDPEKGVNLYGLGSMLNQKESQKKASQRRDPDNQWYEGNCPFFNFRIVDSPQNGSSLSHQEIVDTVIEFGQK